MLVFMLLTYLLHSNAFNVTVQEKSYRDVEQPFLAVSFSARVKWWSLMRSPLKRWNQGSGLSAARPCQYQQVLPGLDSLQGIHDRLLFGAQ